MLNRRPILFRALTHPPPPPLPSLSLFSLSPSLSLSLLLAASKTKFKQLKKKNFKGHITAGFACQIAFSPNGKFLCSGDGDGTLWFWDWRTTKVYRRLNAHKRGPCIGVKWHPIEASTVVTCGWDNVIKLWQ